MLRKAPGTPAHLGIYEVSGALDDIAFGRRVVRHLRVRNVTTKHGLERLGELPELRHLELDNVAGLDLAPLAGLPLDTLVLRDVRDLDLAPLADLPDLELLLLVDLADCRVPERLPLSPSLLNLGVVIDGPGLSGEIVKQLVAAIDWPALSCLDRLGFSVGGNEPLPAVEIDVGFLKQIPRLGFLDLPAGVWPAPDGPALLEPPFDAVPPSLEAMRVTAWDPEATEQLILEHLELESVAVYARPTKPQPAP